MPKISVVVITARPGGIDVLLAGFKQQVFRDFEVVLVDALYEHRRDLVGDLFHTAKIPVVHTPPRKRIFPFDACPQARNAAIAKVNGELIVWLVDYTYLPPRCLDEHWGVYTHFNKVSSGMGAHMYFTPPELAYDLPWYAPQNMFKPNAETGVTYAYNEEASRAFVADLESGFYAPYMGSIFKHPFTDTNGMDEDPHFMQVDPKLHGNFGGVIGGNFFHAKNESTTTELARKVGGFDESYTGHLYDDTDFGHRLEHAGAKWTLLHPVVSARIINPRHFFPHLIRLAATDAHRERYDARRVDSKVVQSDNPYDMKIMSEQVFWYA